MPTSSESEPRDVIQKTAARGALIEVLHGGAVVGGGVLHRVDRVMQFMWLGIVDGLDAALQGAVGAALYCFSMRHAIDVGCTEINLMYAPAHLNNGIHRYKRKLGARVGNDWPYGQLLMKIARLTPAVVSLFANMPFAAVGARGACTRESRSRKTACRPKTCARSAPITRATDSRASRSSRRAPSTSRSCERTTPPSATARGSSCTTSRDPRTRSRTSAAAERR